MAPRINKEDFTEIEDRIKRKLKGRMYYHAERRCDYYAIDVMKRNQDRMLTRPSTVKTLVAITDHRYFYVSRTYRAGMTKSECLYALAAIEEGIDSTIEARTGSRPPIVNLSTPTGRRL